jgi:flavin reductase (DIM6/NTAB) family NADH-FMN oxidoreductase RutF
MADTGREFAKLVAGLDYPLFILTARSGEERSGCLLGFATQVSIHPPRFLACVSVKNRTFRVVAATETVVVHFTDQRHAKLAELFGGESGDDVDKFAQCDWRAGPDGVPVLQELENWFAGRVLQRLDLGDHHGLLLEPVAVHRGQREPQLGFRQAKGIEPGHAP